MNMKPTIKRLSQLTLATVASIAFASCEVDQTQEAKLPDVDIDVKEGQMPKFDVDAPDVDVSVKKKTIEVPVPDIDVTLPKDNNDGNPNQ